MNREKGITIVSEALLAIGTIMVAIAFVLVGGNIINLQTEGLFSSTQNQLSQEITGVINGLPSSSQGTFSTTYEPSIDSYTITVQGQNTIRAEVPGQETTSSTFLALELENTRISSADQICIQKKGSQVNFSEGNCTTGSLDNFCANGRCINDICQPGRGETCANSGGDCVCSGDAVNDEEASDVCKPEYEAESFIEGSDNNAPDSTQPVGCVKDSFTGAQDEKGDRCSYDFECGGSMTCSSPHYTASGVTGKRCCPQGEAWNGSACKDKERYQVVFVPARYSSQSQFSNHADQAFNYFVSKSPFNQCSNPSHKITKTELDISQCNIQNCDIRNTACYSRMIQCANDELGVGNWNKIIGLAKGDGPTVTLPNGVTGTLCGKASGIPSPISISYSACGIDTVSHEVGHTLGLYHISTPGNNEGGACQGPNQEDCNEPVSDRRNFLMSYSDTRNKYGPAGYQYIEEDVVQSYLEGC